MALHQPPQSCPQITIAFQYQQPACLQHNLHTRSLRQLTTAAPGAGGEALRDREEELAVLRLGPGRKGPSDPGQLHRDLQEVQHQSLAVPEEYPRPVAGHPEGGPSHLAPVLPASSSIGLITKAENRMRPMTSGPVSRGLSPDEY